MASKSVQYTDLTGDFTKDFADRITVTEGKTVLARGIEYDVIEESAKNCDAIGSCTFNIEGKGRYVGLKKVSVKITGTSLSDKKIRTIIPVYVYTGEEIELDEYFAVLYNGKILEKDTDYVISSYSKNINAGKATAVLKGINKYTGTRKITFKIAPDTTPVADSRITVAEAFYSKGGSKPAVTIEGMEVNKDYSLKYTNNKKSYTAGKVLITFKGNYKGTPSVTKNFLINPKDISEVDISSKDKVFSDKANAYKSAPVLKDTDGKTLKAGTDYTIVGYTKEDGKVLPSIVAIGTVVKVTVQGKGNYTGTVSTTYRILETGKDISKLTFKIANQEYTGSPVTIDETDITSIKLGKKEQDLVLGRDYVIESHTNNIKKGTAKVTFRGIGEYGGTKTVSFKIGQRNINTYWNGLRRLFGI